MESRARSVFFTLALTAWAGAVGASNHLLLSLDFSDSTRLGAQTDSSLDSLKGKGDVSPSISHPGSADFGTGGMLQGSFHHPAGAFTVETRFLVRDYATGASPYLQTLISTGSLEGRPYQGFALQIGGGHLYPILPQDAYTQQALYTQSLGVTREQRAWLSRCVGEFAFKTAPGGTAEWLEVYTDRCVETGKWNHLVAVWDGLAARIYLNGKDATDMWRLNGAGSKPLFDSTILANIGARTHESSERRHFNGVIDFVRVVDTAMGVAEIRARYGATLPEDSPGTACRGAILPSAPAAGALCDSSCGFELKLDSYGACLAVFEAWDLSPQDSVEVEFSREPDFLDPFLRLTLQDTFFQLGDFLAGLGGDFSGEPCYWRVRLKPAATGLAKAGSAVNGEEWSSPKPIYLTYANPASVRSAARSVAAPRLRPIAGGYLLLGWDDASAPAIFGLDGRREAVSITRLTDGAWLLLHRAAERPTTPRLHLLRSSRGAVPILF